MDTLTKKERVLNTFDYKPLDRLAIYDKIHNLELIEHVTGKKLDEKNAEDVTCEALGKLCDMARHVAVAHAMDGRLVKDEDGFVYKEYWYTKDIIERPFDTEGGAHELVKRDIEKLRSSIDEQRYCAQASWNLKLFGEDAEDPEELNGEFRRVQGKMDGTVMVAPEFFDGIGPLSTRYDYGTFVYLCHDHPSLMEELLDAYLDYQLFRIESFDSTLTPVALVSTAIAGTGGLIYSPEFLRKSYFPRMRCMHDALKRKGYRVIVESEGDNRVIFEDFIEAGIEAYTPLERVSHMHIEEIKAKYPQLVICQEIDSLQLLPFGTKEEVIEETERVKEAFRRFGGVLVGSCGDIHGGVKIENALAMYEAAREPL
jgi:hypothetical protein